MEQPGRFGVLLRIARRAAMFRGKTPLIVAGVLGILAAVLAYQTIKSKEARLASKWNLTPVVVASQDIEEGSALGWMCPSSSPGRL
jgi:hypothetical protein